MMNLNTYAQFVLLAE